MNSRQKKLINLPVRLTRVKILEYFKVFILEFAHCFITLFRILFIADNHLGI